MPLDPRMFRNLSVYQDVVLAGQTVRIGSRDCQGRWEAIAPHLPQAGCVLDVGSNFGWFGWKICEAAPACVVASVEADDRSAAVQREVLQSNQSTRICLLTHRAGARMAHRFAAAGQRFDAVLGLSVLHWIADHREFLATLGAISRRLFVELPDPEEAGAGVERIRREIGRPESYLAGVFPERRSRCLREFPSHRDPHLIRQLWMVDDPPGGPVTASPGLDVSALVDLAPGWPSRSWWLAEFERATAGHDGARSRLLLTPSGLKWGDRPADGDHLAGLRRRLRRVPQRGAFSAPQLISHRVRRWVRRFLWP